MSAKFISRRFEPRDAERYAQWLTAAAGINLVDSAVYQYPSCVTIVVDKEGDSEPVLMNSIQLSIVMEALAPRPGLQPKDEARALKELFEAVKRAARATGVKEVFFGCSDARVLKFVEKHGGEVLKFPMVRFKL